MATDDQFTAILEKISEGNERMARMEIHVDNLQDGLKNVVEQDEVQNKLLAEHIQGTKSNTARLELEIKAREDVESRVSDLEILPTYLKMTYRIFMYAGTIIGVIYEAGRVLHKW